MTNHSPPPGPPTRIVPVLLSGGSGTRLWPASRPDRPKQFLPLIGATTMIRATLERLQGLDIDDPIVVANSSHADLVAAELEAAGHDPGRMILEPVGRNTAPAAAMAALSLSADGDDPVMLLLPADHMISDVATFVAAARTGAELAAAGHLVTFGIVPDRAETGYGYIKTAEPADHGAFRVAEFVEKPDAATAERFLAGGRHLWNSGMFLFRSSTYLRELEAHAPDILSACRTAIAAATRNDGIHLDITTFNAVPSDSIDYAVMEHATDAIVLPLDAGWSDVGSWDSVWDASERDDRGNAADGDVIIIDSTNTLARSQNRLVAIVGVEDIIVVETADAVLVTTRARCQDVRSIVAALRDQARPEVDGQPG